MKRRRLLALGVGLPIAGACGGGKSTGPTTFAGTSPGGGGATTVPSTGPSMASAAPVASETPAATTSPTGAAPTLDEYRVTRGSGPHDVAPAADGSVWYTGQRNGTLGRLDPRTGRVTAVALGPGSAPHGVIVGPDGAAWVTDGGLDAILRVDAQSGAIRSFPLPGRPGANLNTATFDRTGRLWFTGQSGFFGSVEPESGRVTLSRSPRGAGPYGICTTPDGRVFYASLAGNHIAQVDVATGEATPIDPPTRGQGARRVWADSQGSVWVSEWNVGQVSRYEPRTGAWKSWKLPSQRPQAYAVYVDDRDMVWLTDFGANAIVRFDPRNEQFLSLPLPKPDASVRQLLGRPGEVWGAESSADALVVVRS